MKAMVHIIYLFISVCNVIMKPVSTFIYTQYLHILRLSTTASPAPRLFTPSSHASSGHRKLAGSMGKLLDIFMFT